MQHHTKILSEYLSFKNDITVLTTYDQSRKVINKNKRINIIDFKIKGNLVKGYSGNINEYQNHLLNSNYDIIMFYAAQQWTFDLALPILDKITARIIFIPCGFSKINNLFYKIYYTLILNNKIKYIDKFVFFSKNTNDYLFLKRKIKNNSIHVISNGGEKFSFGKTIVKKNTILYVANFTFLKNQLYLIIAMLFIKKKSFVNFIYSKKTYYYYFCKMASLLISTINNKIHFKYFLNPSRKNINNQYKMAKLFVCTSKIECAPLMIADCLTCNLKFISSNVGNIRDTIKYYKRGYIYNSFSELINLIKSNLEITSYEKIADKRYTWKKYLKQYDKVYKF